MAEAEFELHSAVGTRSLVERSAGLVRTERVQPSMYGPAAELQVLGWGTEHGLLTDEDAVERFAAIRCGSCAAHTYPNAPREVIELGADLIGWLFLFDDFHGETRDLVTVERVFQSFEPLLFDGRLPDAPTPFHRALADLRARILRRSDERLVRRFAYSVRRYFDGCLLELPYRSTGRSPSLSVYRSLRRWSIGVQPVLDLVELSLPVPLDAEMAAKSQVWSLRDHAATLCAWANDLYSFHKEQRDRDPLNLVSVLLHERALSVDLAFADAVRLYNEDLAAFESACATFLATPSTTALEASYLRGVRDWVFGNHQWTRESRRYA